MWRRIGAILGLAEDPREGEIPEEEREEFAAANHVADLSSRELEKLIRERDAAQEETAQAACRQAAAA